MEERFIIKKESCKKIILDILSTRGEAFETVKHANSFCFLVDDIRYQSKTGYKQMQNAVKELKAKKIIEQNKITGYFQLVPITPINDNTIRSLLDLQALGSPLLLSAQTHTLFLPVQSKNIEFVITLIETTEVNQYIITMVPTYNGIIMYVDSELYLPFKESFKKISGYSISK